MFPLPHARLDRCARPVPRVQAYSEARTDTTLGVLFVAACIRLSQHVLVERLGLHDYASGHYGDDPHHPNLDAFGKQLGVYLGALCGMKALVLLAFALVPAIFSLGDFLLSWLTFRCACPSLVATKRAHACTAPTRKSSSLSPSSPPS